MKFWICWRENGMIEMADITFRTATTNNDQDPILNIVFSLEGVLEENVLKLWIKDLIEKRDESGQLVHKHFKCRLVELKGFLAWKTDLDFDVKNHVIVAPSHHHGTILTDRNIQEYISEMCSDNLPKEHSPWQVKIASGLADKGIQVTWVVFRLHHLLSTQINLPDYSLSLPNPWDSVCSTKVFTLLEAPSATKKVLRTFGMWFSGLLHHYIHIFYSCFQDITKINSKLFNFTDHREKILYFKCKLMSHIDNLLTLRSKTDITALLYIINILIFGIFTILFDITIYITLNIYNFLNYLINKLIFIYELIKNITFGKNTEIKTLMQALIELYWMMRAILSLPRLMMEEIFYSRNTAPLYIWRRKGLQRWKRAIVAWTEEIPLEGAKGIQGVSGASLSCVLITALSGAIRDLLRFSGFRSPDNVRCTLPVCIPHTSPNHGLLPLSLPTGCSNGQQALREVSKAVDRMKKYPETYLASAWLVRNLPEFLPEIVFGCLMKYLSRSYPVLLINLVGSSLPSQIWGLKLRSTFYWRPPQNDAVLSVCISSYCGNISMGIMADGWAVPHAHFLPQSFVSHLNELAVESGVKLQRKNSNICSGTRTPRSSSSTTPPPTPHVNSIWNSQNNFSFSSNLKSRLKLNRIKKKRNLIEASE